MSYLPTTARSFNLVGVSYGCFEPASQRASVAPTFKRVTGIFIELLYK